MKRNQEIKHRAHRDAKTKVKATSPKTSHSLLSDLLIETLDQEGRGVARLEGKTIFVQGGLPGERVNAVKILERPRYDLAQVSDILEISDERVMPQCTHFGICGGCRLQHLDIAAQRKYGEANLLRTLWHIGRVEPKTVFPMLEDRSWGYRRRARLSIEWRDRVWKIGFRGVSDRSLVEVTQCPVLTPALEALLLPVRESLQEISHQPDLTALELLEAEGVAHLVFAHSSEFTDADLECLASLQKPTVQVWTQLKGGDFPIPLTKKEVIWPCYRLPGSQLELAFSPSNFIQGNERINQKLIHTALDLLQLQPQDRVADLFCGVGNFTLPMARLAQKVIGIEGSPDLIAFARDNSVRNQLQDKTDWIIADLFKNPQEIVAQIADCTHWVLDPPREGAMELFRTLNKKRAPETILYISCNPATLARDAAEITGRLGYDFAGVGLADMFPHTGHTEAIALFKRK